jgi:hypothetical protein
MARIRTLNFLPEVFQTPTNAEFLAATLDHLVNNPISTRFQGYVGSRLGNGVNALDYYVVEPTKDRTVYQLEPGVVFTKQNEPIAKDFISYPGIIDALNMQGGVTDNNDRLFQSEFYSWDSFCNLDKLVNYNEYYWIPEGLPPVTVSPSVVYTNEDFIVTDYPNTYGISRVGSTVNLGNNPTLSLLRGGTYTFTVNQNSDFWIQTDPGTSGTKKTQPNIPTREVYGVSNNGASVGMVTFTVPYKNDQDEFVFPGNNIVDVVSTLPFSQVNGQHLYDIYDQSTGINYPGLNSIDGVSGLDGLRVMFYNTGDPAEVGYVSSYYNELSYDVNDPTITSPRTAIVVSTSSTGNVLTLGTGYSTSLLVPNQTVTFSGNTLGGLIAGQVYFVKEIISDSTFTLSASIEGEVVAVSTQSGINVVTNINQGQYEQGFYTNVSENFYRIQLIGDLNNPILRLLPDGVIPNKQKITPSFGTEWINRPFYRNDLGVISLIPQITAPLDTLYYQDGTNSNKVGIIKIIENNNTNFINVYTEILGKTQYTSPNGVEFTNGLKIEFDGIVYPNSYLTDQYYVEGVGTAIELVPISSTISPEKFTEGKYIPWDSLGFDVGNYDINLYIPVLADYITIARNSISKNAWSRSNRWFHTDVVSATATYNDNPAILTTYATQYNKAKRPIIEFYPNLKLFNSGIFGKKAVDFLDTRELDALSNVAGLNNYYPDVETYSNDLTATVAGTVTAPVVATSFVLGSTYQIASLGVGTDWNVIAGTLGVYYEVGDIILCNVVGAGTGTAVLQAVGTTIAIPSDDVVGTFQTGMYVGDTLAVVPPEAQITNISDDGTTTTLTISWPYPSNIDTTTTTIVGTDGPASNYALFPGARVVFAADTDVDTRGQIYVANFVVLAPNTPAVIVLNLAEDGEVVIEQQVAVNRGYHYQGTSFYYTATNSGLAWIEAQEKITVNQAPKFDIFDANGISLGDPDIYNSTTFKGSTLFSYGIGSSGVNDSVLGFPLRYSAVTDISDISFDVTLNSQTFNYVRGFDSITQKVNTGYVYNYTSPTTIKRQIGWETAVEPSVQYQAFSFDFTALAPTNNFPCDVPVLADLAYGQKGWPRVQVYFNNIYQDPSIYTYTVVGNSTVFFFNTLPTVDSVIQILVLSDQVSTTGYYVTPTNLNNNPFNADLTKTDLGDLKMQYQDVFINAPNTTGDIFGANNFRDCGDLIPYGTKIIQNSASLVLPGVFLRKQNHSLMNALLFNSREYINYKQLLVNTVQNTDYVQHYSPADILDDAIDQISASRSEINAFFWSDMLPSKAPFRTNTYTFNSNMDVTRYPLSHVYNFDSANYDGVLVYLTTKVNNNYITKQLLTGVDYIVSTDAPTLTVTTDLVPGDKITIKEYNQTYGSYVPYTPTKLGLYPLHQPSVVLDSDYMTPTYFIKGHDGSYTKLYGEYIPEADLLVDFRDQALLEFEKRIFNNVKLSTIVPIQFYDVVPGFFRNSDYSYSEWLEMYSSNFLNWVGQNRLDYKTQFYNRNNPYTYNYSNGSNNKLNNQPIQQGYWRGVYQYFYDTTTPNLTPWEMLGFANMPDWWTARYGPAPYTSNNLVLWNDLEAGLVWNNGHPYTVSQLARPGLTNIIPVDASGNLLDPLQTVTGSSNPSTYQKDWKVGDDSPVEFSYRRSSSYPFDVIKLFALTRPAEFYNLAVDLDNYKYNAEFNQYLINDRSHLVISDVQIYGDGIPKTSYINWIVDFEKQQGVDATASITELLDNLDVRLVYRLAGFSDKTLLNFYVEKGSPNASNSALLIPDESYSVLLYENQPFDNLQFSSVVVQQEGDYWTVYGNAQTFAYFTVLKPIDDGNSDTITAVAQSVKVAKNYSTTETLVPYGTKFYTAQEVSQFLMSYSAYLQSKGMLFNNIVDGIEFNWPLMVQEFLYWVQTGWETGSVITLNPSATSMSIDKPGSIVQPLTIQSQNFILNQNLYPIQLKDMQVNRDGTAFNVHVLNDGDSMAYSQFNMSNIEHGIVFDNTTLFNDVIYDLVTGLRQNRITVRGTKTAEWNGTLDAWGFILNQDNVQPWSNDLKYPKGIIVKYKNKYWTALDTVEPSMVFDEKQWKIVDYQNIQKGLLPNSATRAYESTLYYNINNANLEQDADLLSFSLIGYRPRDYLALADLTDITQINVYKNMIRNKGTKNAASAFNGANLPQGGIQYDLHENWAIKTGEYGGVLNSNFVEFRLDQPSLTGNPSIVSLTNGIWTEGAQQEVPIYGLFNYGQVVSDPNILNTTSHTSPELLYPSAGYANFNDVKMSSYYYAGLKSAVDTSGAIVPITDFYVRDYMWLANYKEKWGIYAWKPLGQVIAVNPNVNGTATVTFSQPHNLSRLDPMAIINFAPNVDGYYIVTEVLGLNEIIINLTVTNNAGTAIQGQGIGLRVISQRVVAPSEIANLDLLEAEFQKNTVWVDENYDGGWSVYRKSINYQLTNQVSIDNSGTFGYAVAYDPNAGNIVGDPALGKVYKWNIDVNTQILSDTPSQTITGNPTFGSKIVHAGNVFVVSEPNSVSPVVKVYVWNNSLATDDLIPYQTITAPGGVTANWGSELAISGDQNWLYISDNLHTKVHVYRKDQIPFNDGYLTIGQTYTITSLGNSNFTSVGADQNSVGNTFVATGTGTIGNTGTVMRVTYQPSAIIDGAALGFGTTDGFGKSMTTDYNGSHVFIGAPNKDNTNGITDWGSVYFYQRTVENFESQSASVPYQPHTFPLAWTPTTVSTSVTSTINTTDYITLSSTAGISVNDPIIFTGVGLGDTGVPTNVVFYVRSIVSGNRITIKTSRSSTTRVQISSKATITGVTASVQTTPLYVTVNGNIVNDNNYAVVGSNFVYTGSLLAGDIINVSGNQFVPTQSFNADVTDTINVQFGYAMDTTQQATELLIGSPYELNLENKEGKVYRFTNAGAKFGIVIGTGDCNVTGESTLLINGFPITLTAGDASHVASLINAVPNIQASSADNKLIIQVINSDLTVANQKLLISSFDTGLLAELGIDVYSPTQVIVCPHQEGPTEFGKAIKFNEFDSVIIGAPIGPNIVGTTFDFTDDENLDNDTIFDNNSTRFVDTYPNAGAVYMFDLLSDYNSSLLSPGAFVYAQITNSAILDSTLSPYYGSAIDFNNNNIIVGAPTYEAITVGGQITTFNNATGIRDWSEYRQSAPIVDIEKINNTQIFNAVSNITLVNLDYMDPLQGKLLGAVRENIDYVTSTDPAHYNSTTGTNTSFVWGEQNVGEVWYNTNGVRYVNYHQNDVTYNSKYWGTLFPGSDVAVYTWVASSNPPSSYQGPGIPYSQTNYSVGSTLNASNVITPVYYFWARNTGIISQKRGKTLADTTVASYIANPRASGIAYMAPLLPNTFALYNSIDYINANTSVFHIGYENGEASDVTHSEYTLIRENYSDDFLPGFPNAVGPAHNLPSHGLYSVGGYDLPSSLYARMLDSLSGCNTTGGVIPDPNLPKAVQTGVLSRPRQSFFYNRLTALENYFGFANTIMAQYPMTELKPNATFFTLENDPVHDDNGNLLFAAGEQFNVKNYWSFINWWAPGYNNSTRSSLQVAQYADLAELNVPVNTIVKVEQNGEGRFEVYRFDSTGLWTRIGLENGTYELSSSLWDYAAANLGYSGDFFDTTPYDSYPSEETRYLVRALNEQIYTGDFLIYRNASLILLFEYIQSETIESQNYLSWLTKTSLLDVSHTIRELKPYRVYKSDNAAFLEGYINEVKPYHVVLKEYLLKYTGGEVFEGDITDFDLPASWNSAYQQYISPELVYSTPSNQYQYASNSPIWTNPQYSQWFQNHGLSITGQPDYQITTLKSYMDLGTRYMIVDNAAGFPTVGVVKIGEELISYSYVQRDLNLLGGISRGLHETPITQHIPGSPIIIDLPAVLVLDGGSGYTDVPKVTAYYDTALYPAPTKEAILQPVMAGTSVVAIEVIDPGKGYPVLPEIKIDPAYTVYFANTAINSTLHTINVYAPNLVTGNLVKFKAGTNGVKPTKLVSGEWYYVNVLETLPSIIIALYTNYSDAINDTNRIELADGGDTIDMSIAPGARASIVTSSTPTRENNITIKFDRTTYGSQVLDWEADSFYGAFFAGTYNNSSKVSSSAITLESTQPDINTIIASAQGVALEIESIANDQVVEWSSFVRNLGSTLSTNNSVRLTPSSLSFVATGSISGTTMNITSVTSGTVVEGTLVYGTGVNPDTKIISQLSGTTGGAGLYKVSISQITSAGITINGYEVNASGTTLGFYVGMPIKFNRSFGAVVYETPYYVRSIINDLDFTLSDSNGALVTMPSSTITPPGVQCYVGEVTDTAILTVNYPGILTVTNTTATTNAITVPMSEIGTGGTAGFYTNLSVFFTGTVFGGIVQNEIYYITTVIDDQTFTISEKQDPLSTTVSQTYSSTNIVEVDSTVGFSVNDPIIFTDLTGTLASSNIVAGTTYYIRAILNGTQFIIAQSVNGSAFALANGTGTATITNQKDTLSLTTGSGTMTMNVSLPVSPGQVNGQLFTLYQSSGQYPGIVSENYSDLIKRVVRATIGTNYTVPINRIAIAETEGGTTNFYVNMPIVPDSTIGGLTGGTTYYVIEYSGMEDPLNPGEYLPNIQVTATTTSSIGNIIDCDSTASLYLDMPIVFSGIGLGGIVIGQEYFVKTITSSTTFTISETLGGAVKTLATANGLMVGTGDAYIKVSTSLGGSTISLTDTNSASATFVQTPNPFPGSNPPEFDLSYMIGGYRAIITNPSSGFAITNKISISGTAVDGTSPANDLVMTVNTIDANGGITSVIIEGTVPSTATQYYLQVRSPNTLAVYSNSLMTIPVGTADFPYVGFTSTIATTTTASNNRVGVTDSTIFDLNDQVFFTGTIFDSEIILGQPYYIKSKPTTTSVTLSTIPGGTELNITTSNTGSMTMAKIGSIALLPEPFYFNQSIVKYNNRVWICVVSNNDKTFILGKWEEINSGDTRLNAMDRVMGYYRPTVNMPGVDLTQLFEGVTYPNATYMGNPFQPNQQYELDTILTDLPFYPTEVMIESVLWNGTNYFAAANLPNYSAVLASVDGENWGIGKLTSSNINTTDVVFGAGYYVMTSNNPVTPILRSNNGIEWSSNGYFTPYGIDYDATPYDSTSLSVASISLNSVEYYNNSWVAVGENIIRSDDSYSWNQVTFFNPSYEFQLFGISEVNTSYFNGLIAVGKGKAPDYTSGVTELVDINLFLTSIDGGYTWNQVDPVVDKGFYGIASNNTTAVAVGESSVIYYTQNGTNWLGLGEVGVTFVNSSTNVLNLTNTAGLAVNDTVRFNNAFSTILANTTYYVKSIVSPTQITLSNTLGGSTKTLTYQAIPNRTWMTSYNPANPTPATLRDVIYANGVWVAVGDLGTIKTSSDGVNWTSRTSGTTNDLNGITYNSVESAFVVVGDNNTVLTSTNAGVNWVETVLFTPTPTVYDVKGADFQFGYGPEELVPGVVTDNLAMIVTTRPGTNWPEVEYSHVGYNSISVELEPTSSTQTVYSFDNVVKVPAQLSVQTINGSTGLGSTLAPSNYSINWVNKTITLDSPLKFSPVKDMLRVDVYEVGNSDQLVKSSTDTDPIRMNDVTGFNEIYLSCNYSAVIYQGSGVVRAGAENVNVKVFATDGTSYRISCEDVTHFVINSAITFQGVPFGNLEEDTVYYVKTISRATNTITISASYDTVTGNAGPTLVLTTATGTMYANIQNGAATVWSTPYVMNNGVGMVLGTTGLATRTKASNNAITVGSTAGIIVNSPITFGSTVFGNVIQPLTTYYVKSVVDGNEFTISETQGGPVLVLTDATGGVTYITNDYAFTQQPNSTAAKMILADETFTNADNYIVYSILGETQPAQYGYAIPEFQYFTGDGSSSTFYLANFAGYDNPKNAIVEINGVRQTYSKYQISSITNTIEFVNPPAVGAKISVLTYNDTERQYLTSQYGITGNPGSSLTSLTVGSTTHSVGTFDQNSPTVQAYDQNSPAVVLWDQNLNYLTLSVGNTSSLNINDPIVFNSPTIGGIVAGQTYYVTEILNSTDFVVSTLVGGEAVEVTTASGSMVASANSLTVAPIGNITNTITPPIASTFATSTTAPHAIGVDSTSGFVSGQPIQFYGTSFGGIATDGTVYFVGTITNSSSFTITDYDGNVITVSNGSGNIKAVVGGTPAVRVTTTIANAFIENSIIRIDGTQGSIQLNNNIYYAKIINPYTFDLYTQPYDSAIDATNYPVTTISSYTGGGYTWRQGLFYIQTTTATATTTLNHTITVDSTASLIPGTPVYFNKLETLNGTTLLGGLVQGTKYFVKEVVNDTTFTVSLTRYGDVVEVTTDSGYIGVTQWSQRDKDRLWITVNGYRVPTSSLTINDYNEVGILTEIAAGDEVIITSMIPDATPNEDIYINYVGPTNKASIYRVNPQITTWLTQPIYELSTTIYVDDVSKLTKSIVQNVTTPALESGYYYIGLTADKTTITNVTVLNNTTGNYIDPSNYTIQVVDLTPTLKITSGSYIAAGNSLTITTLEGNALYVNGETIIFGTVDFVNNSISELERGANGTARQYIIPEYATVYGLLTENKLNPIYYDTTWNSNEYNQVLGDPLQVSVTPPAYFLNTNIT